jgi:hypothetical protein
MAASSVMGCWREGTGAGERAEVAQAGRDGCGRRIGREEEEREWEGKKKRWRGPRQLECSEGGETPGMHTRKAGLSFCRNGFNICWSRYSIILLLILQMKTLVR